MEARGHQLPWSWSGRCLWAAWCEGMALLGGMAGASSYWTHLSQQNVLDLQGTSLMCSSAYRHGFKLSLFKSWIMSRVLAEAIWFLTFKAPGTRSQQVTMIMIDTRSNSTRPGRNIRLKFLSTTLIRSEKIDTFYLLSGGKLPFCSKGILLI